MNILNLLIEKKNVVGIEINDSFIRIAYFRPPKKFNKDIHLYKIPEDHLILAEEILPDGIVKNGIIEDKEQFQKILKNLWLKEKLKKSYAIISIQEDKVYSRIFPFPKTQNEESLPEAINLAIDFQMPVKKDDIYIDWENASDSNVLNEIQISSIQKIIANDYIKACSYAGIKILALETHLASIARAIKTPLGQAILFTKKNKNGTTIFILKDGIVRFYRFIPIEYIKDENFLQKEINHIKTAYESEKKTTLEILPFENVTLREEYLKFLDPKNTSQEMQLKWLAPIGAIIRGKIENGKDNLISLLPVGTEEAYKFQKTMTFISFIRHILVAVSIFFLATFIVIYIFVFSLSQTANKKNTLSVLNVSQDAIAKEALIKKVNGLTLTSKNILSDAINWSILIEELNSKISPGIIVTNFSAPSVNELMTLTGIAKDRDILNQFKQTLSSSSYLTNVNLPITNLEQKGDIPFSISFNIKNISMLYYK